jgi:hypothetical protein
MAMDALHVASHELVARAHEQVQGQRSELDRLRTEVAAQTEKIRVLEVAVGANNAEEGAAQEGAGAQPQPKEEAEANAGGAKKSDSTIWEGLGVLVHGLVTGSGRNADEAEKYVARIASWGNPSMEEVMGRLEVGHDPRC